MTRWMAEPYFWTAVAAPALAAIAVALRNRANVAANAGIWAGATVMTVASAYADFRWLLGLPHDPFGVYALPVFPVAYLIAGRYRVASAAVCFAGTYGSLIATDLVVFGQRWLVGAPDAAETLIGIGAGRPIDGLLAAPVSACVVTWLVARLQRRGMPMRIFRSRLKT